VETFDFVYVNMLLSSNEVGLITIEDLASDMEEALDTSRVRVTVEAQ